MKDYSAMSEISELQHQLDDAKERMERRDMAARLAQNADFKKLILEEFCVNECARYAQVSGDPMQDATARADCLAIAQAAGHLRRWLQVVHQMGSHAANNRPAIEDAIDELRASGAE